MSNTWINKVNRIQKALIDCSKGIHITKPDAEKYSRWLTNYLEHGYGNSKHQIDSSKEIELMNELDKAIEVLQGNYDNAAAVRNGVGNWLWKTNGLKGYQGVSDSSKGWSGEYICTRAEFEARAKKKGWVNGYKWGKEYQCDGKKPNLPDDVVVEWTASDGLSAEYQSGGLNWEGKFRSPVCKFRIVDERHRPVEFATKNDANPWREDDSPTNWHERGELPPVGAECEYSLGDSDTWWKCKIRLIVGTQGVVMESNQIFEGVQYCSLTGKQAVRFRPIKTDRERFIDAVNAVLGPEKLIAIQLFDAGFKAPDNID